MICSEKPEDKKNHLGYIDLMSKSLNLMAYRISALTIELYKPDIVINISKDAYGIYDFHKAKEIIEAGVRATRRAMNNQQ